MKKMRNTLANKVLKSWINGFNTNNWNEYIQLLSDDFIFEISDWTAFQKESMNSALELFEDLKKMGVSKITTMPKRITSNEEAVVFEFQEPFSGKNTFSSIGFALSFDCEKGSITAFREYYAKNNDTF